MQTGVRITGACQLLGKARRPGDVLTPDEVAELRLPHRQAAFNALLDSKVLVLGNGNTEVNTSERLEMLEERVGVLEAALGRKAGTSNGITSGRLRPRMNQKEH